MKTTRHLLPILAMLALATVAAGAIRPSSPVALDNALRDASRLVASHPELKVLRVEGVSMLPYFGKDSVLVVKPAASASLKPGMIVVYHNRFGETVAHRIVGGDATSGWVVKGYNNTASDSTRVNDANLVGTVYATLFATDTKAPTELAGDFLAADTPVALAAPAR